jgi:hypothetical protein
MDWADACGDLQGRKILIQKPFAPSGLFHMLNPTRGSLRSPLAIGRCPLRGLGSKSRIKIEFLDNLSKAVRTNTGRRLVRMNSLFRGSKKNISGNIRNRTVT